MQRPYPPLKAGETYRLPVSRYHSVYVETCGNPAGIPVVVLHGGPGSGCAPHHRQFFDPARYFIVLFDQRGCGRSTPRGETRRNTTGDLIRDMEKIRRRLKIRRWVIFGGSWGATLGLLYARQHPQRVSALVLRGTFLARRRDLHWFAQEGASELFPEAWQSFISDIPVAERHDLVRAYHHRVHGGDLEQRIHFARRWHDWSSAVVAQGSPAATDGERILDKIRIETHYALHRYFIGENAILDSCHALPGVAIHIIHGECDQVCPVQAARTLAGHLPAAELQIVAGAGHIAEDPAITDRLIEATDAVAQQLGG